MVLEPVIGMLEISRENPRNPEFSLTIFLRNNLEIKYFLRNNLKTKIYKKRTSCRIGTTKPLRFQPLYYRQFIQLFNIIPIIHERVCILDKNVRHCRAPTIFKLVTPLAIILARIVSVLWCRMSRCINTMRVYIICRGYYFVCVESYRSVYIIHACTAHAY